jgi:hypothetical protein
VSRVVCTRHLNYSRMHEIGELCQADLGKKVRPYLQINQSKKKKKKVGLPRGMAQGVESLPSECKALSSNPILPKKSLCKVYSYHTVQSSFKITFGSL